MEDLFRVVFGTVVVLMGAILGRVFYMLDKKANKDSTDNRFKETMTAIKSHMETCDKKADRVQDTLDSIKRDVSETRTQVAVLTARVDGND